MLVFCIVTLSHVVSSSRDNIMTKEKRQKDKSMFDINNCTLSNMNLTICHWVNTYAPQRLVVLVTLISPVV
jgi:hypothetical protein